MKTEEQIVAELAKAWETLDAELIIANLDNSFVYDSQWVFESLDYEGYKNYIRAKFKAIRESSSAPKGHGDSSLSHQRAGYRASPETPMSRKQQ